MAGGSLLLGAILILRASWLQRGRLPALRLLGWMTAASSLALFIRSLGVEVGITYALLAAALLAYAVIAAGAELRSARAPREPALEPEERPVNWPRIVAKSLLAIVLAGIASIGLGLVFALFMPMPVADRIVVGGLLVPIFWGAGMAWTLCDAKLGRATLLLVVISLASYALAFYPKVLG
jgi:hypothetical protein